MGRMYDLDLALLLHLDTVKGIHKQFFERMEAKEEANT
jgi:hypothetical protein